MIVDAYNSNQYSSLLTETEDGNRAEALRVYDRRNLP